MLTSRNKAYQFLKSLRAVHLESIALLIVLLLLGLSPATAQDGPSRNHSATSLHVNVNVVPSVYVPKANQISHPEGSVEYALSPSLSRMEITTQTSNFTFVNAHGVSETAVLVITTVVLP